MLNLQRHEAFVWRYILAEVLHSILGFCAKVILVGVGVASFILNLFGYALGLAAGITTSKSFKFRSRGRLASEALRRFATFGSAI